MKKLGLLLLIVLAALPGIAQIEYSSHRGSSLEAPENTVASFMLAWKQGADAVEIDVHLSKDNRLMVIHDSNTKRTTGEDYVVKETHSDVLRKLDAGSFKGEKYRGEKIPFLEEIIDLLPPGKKLIVELKCDKKGLPVLEKIIRNSPKKRQIDIICFDFDVLVEAKKLLPDNYSHLLIGKEEGLKEAIKKASEAKIEAVDLKHSLIDQEIVSYVHDLSMQVFAWTVDDPAIANRLVALNVDGIESNCVSCLKEKMKR